MMYLIILFRCALISKSVVVTYVYHSFPMLLVPFYTLIDSIILDMLDSDVSLSMTWLPPYHTLLNCNAKIVPQAMLGLDKLKWEGLNKAKLVRIISFV